MNGLVAAVWALLCRSNIGLGRDGPKIVAQLDIIWILLTEVEAKHSLDVVELFRKFIMEWKLSEQRVHSRQPASSSSLLKLCIALFEGSYTPTEKEFLVEQLHNQASDDGKLKFNCCDVERHSNVDSAIEPPLLLFTICWVSVALSTRTNLNDTTL